MDRMRPLRLDALIRVSMLGDRDAKDLRSPDQQRGVIRAWTGQNRAKVAREHVNVGLSGKTTLGRSDVEAVLKRVREGKTDGLIVAYASRLSRARVGEAERLKDAILEAGGRLVICDMGGEYADTATGELAFTVLSAVSRYQWRQIKDRYDSGRKDAIARGKWVGMYPFGYRYAEPARRANGRGRIDTHLVPDERTASIIAELFQRKADGDTWLQLARWLDQVAPKPDGGYWTRRAVEIIIKNRVYLGESRHGEYVNLAAHEALITPALWRAAQKPTEHVTPEAGYLLTSLVRCGTCGHRLRGKPMGTRRNVMYGCSNPDCRYKVAIMVANLDTEIIRQCADRISTFAAAAPRDQSTTQLDAQTKYVATRINNLMELVPASRAGISAHQRKLAALEAQLQALEDSRYQVAAQSPQRALNGLPDSVRISEPHERYDKLASVPLDTQRRILRTWIKRIDVTRAKGLGRVIATADRVSVTWKI
jgi:DNA invertase Pin-like site-specific DNA recombinase